MITMEALKNYGANVEEGLARCVNNEAFYLRMVDMGLADANFDRLGQAIDAGDVKAAFDAAHALKGVAGNLALTPLYTPLSELTELLRGKSEMGNVDALYAEIQAQLAKIRALKD